MSIAVGGVDACTIDGDPVNVKGNVSWQLGTEMREVEAGLDGSLSYAVKPRPAALKMTVTIDGSTDVKALLEKVNATVVLNWRSGRISVLRGGIQTGEGETNVETTELPLEFKGNGEDLLA